MANYTVKAVTNFTVHSKSHAYTKTSGSAKSSVDAAVIATETLKQIIALQLAKEATVAAITPAITAMNLATTANLTTVNTNVLATEAKIDTTNANVTSVGIGVDTAIAGIVSANSKVDTLTANVLTLDGKVVIVNDNVLGVPNLVWQETLEVLTAEEIMRVVLAALAGARTTIGTGIEHYANVGNTKPRITFTSDSFGNGNVSLDGTL